MVRRVDQGSDEATLNELSRRILGAAFHIHTGLGPGLKDGGIKRLVHPFPDG